MDFPETGFINIKTTDYNSQQLEAFHARGVLKGFGRFRSPSDDYIHYMRAPEGYKGGKTDVGVMINPMQARVMRDLMRNLRAHVDDELKPVFDNVGKYLSVAARLADIEINKLPAIDADGNYKLDV